MQAGEFRLVLVVLVLGVLAFELEVLVFVFLEFAEDLEP